MGMRRRRRRRTMVQLHLISAVTYSSTPAKTARMKMTTATTAALVIATDCHWMELDSGCTMMRPAGGSASSGWIVPELSNHPTKPMDVRERNHIRQVSDDARLKSIVPAMSVPTTGSQIMDRHHRHHQHHHHQRRTGFRSDVGSCAPYATVC